MNETIKNIYNDLSTEQLENYLSDACYLGQLDRVQYLIEEKQVNINFRDDEAIREACRGNNLDVVKYLLTSSNLEKHSDLNNFPENGIPALASACVRGSLDLVQYLLISDDLAQKADISLQNYSAFKLAYYRKHDDIINYLIFDYKIEEAYTILHHLKSTLPYDGDQNYAEGINRMFLARTLNNEIPLNKEQNKKVKL